MGNPFILSLATGVPKYAFAQTAIAQELAHRFGVNEKRQRVIERIFQNASIAKRHTVLPHLVSPDLSMGERNDLYKAEAPQLAVKAAEAAISDWGGEIGSFSHVISVSCTGMIAPGIEFLLAKKLGLNPGIKRLGINFMGCFGAFQGLRTAAQIARNDPNHRVLVVCTELCSLHFQFKDSLESIVINSLFADGAAAVVVGCHPQPGERPCWEWVDDASYALDDSLDALTWEAGNFGYDMRLASGVGAVLETHISGFVDRLLPAGIGSSDCDWAVHPGGKAILQAIERGMTLKPDQIQASWEVLGEFGNMSSPTVLYVLDRLIRRPPTNREWVAGLGFGPGLSVEGMVLRRCSP